GVDGCQLPKRRIDGKVVRTAWGRHIDCVERHLQEKPAAFVRVAGASVLDENLPHRARGPCKKLSPADISLRANERQADEDLMHKGGWLQCVMRPLVFKIASGDTAQFAVRDLNKIPQRK